MNGLIYLPAVGAVRNNSTTNSDALRVVAQFSPAIHVSVKLATLLKLLIHESEIFAGHEFGQIFIDQLVRFETKYFFAHLV